MKPNLCILSPIIQPGILFSFVTVTIFHFYGLFILLVFFIIFNTWGGALFDQTGMDVDMGKSTAPHNGVWG